MVKAISSWKASERAAGVVGGATNGRNAFVWGSRVAPPVAPPLSLMNSLHYPAVSEMQNGVSNKKWPGGFSCTPPVAPAAHFHPPSCNDVRSRDRTPYVRSREPFQKVAAPLEDGEIAIAVSHRRRSGLMKLNNNNNNNNNNNDNNNTTNSNNNGNSNGVFKIVANANNARANTNTNNTASNAPRKWRNKSRCGSRGGGAGRSAGAQWGVAKLTSTSALRPRATRARRLKSPKSPPKSRPTAAAAAQRRARGFGGGQLRRMLKPPAAPCNSTQMIIDGYNRGCKRGGGGAGLKRPLGSLSSLASSLSSLASPGSAAAIGRLLDGKLDTFGSMLRPYCATAAGKDEDVALDTFGTMLRPYSASSGTEEEEEEHEEEEECWEDQNECEGAGEGAREQSKWGVTASHLTSPVAWTPASPAPSDKF